MYKPSTYLSSCLFSYLSTSICDLFLTELVTKVKPNILTRLRFIHNWVIGNRHPVVLSSYYSRFILKYWKKKSITDQHLSSLITWIEIMPVPSCSCCICKLKHKGKGRQQLNSAQFWECPHPWVLYFLFFSQEKNNAELYKNEMLAKAEFSVSKKPNGISYSASRSLDTIEKLSPFPSLKLS